MATTVVSGEVALLLQRRPSLTPDQVKGVLAATVGTAVVDDLAWDDLAWDDIAWDGSRLD